MRANSPQALRNAQKHGLLQLGVSEHEDYGKELTELLDDACAVKVKGALDEEHLA